MSNDLSTPPEGWKIHVIEGWFAQPRFSGDRDYVPAGRVQLPRTFCLSAVPPGAAPPPSGEWIILYFSVVDSGEVVMPLIFSRGVDVPRALDLLREARPLDWWRRHAITEMVSRGLLLELDIRDSERAQEDEDYTKSFIFAYKGGDEDEPKIAVNLGEIPHVPIMTPERWAKAVPLPLSRPRNRITDDHLAEVVKVYQAADEKGRPPTRAVANAFNTSHSTAARWVGQARKKAMLPPAVREDRGESS